MPSTVPDRDKPVVIKTIGFRRLLPVLNLLLYVAFACVGSAGELSSVQTHSTHVDTVPVGTRFVVAANVPAVLVAFALNATAFHFQPNRLFLLGIPFVPLLWYPVGYWIDRRVGWIPRRKPIRTMLRDAFLASAALIATLSVVVFIQTIRRGYPGPMGYGVCAWFAFLLTVLARMLYSRLFDS